MMWFDKANTVKHRHANIHKALSYAFKMDLIVVNPADKVELPKIEKYRGHFYNAEQIEKMFETFRGDPAEFGVIAAAYYGLRRSEVIGLKWEAVDFVNKTITIQHTVNEANIDGRHVLVMSDSTKTKSSCRTLPLVPPFEALLIQMREEQERNRKLCGSCYCKDYLDYIYVNQIGEIIQPGYLIAHVPAVLKANNMPPIRFHDLRHSCASLLFSQGVSMKEIQAWLGHSTIGTTANIYTHLEPMRLFLSFRKNKSQSCKSSEIYWCGIQRLDLIKEHPPSSRRMAAVHRTAAFRWVRVRLHT